MPEALHERFADQRMRGDAVHVVIGTQPNALTLHHGACNALRSGRSVGQSGWIGQMLE